MESAALVLVLSIVMVVGGRRLMRVESHSRAEGLLSCVIGIGLSVAWYKTCPEDFADLADFVSRTFQRTASAGNGVPAFALAALLPASLAVLCLFIVYRFEQRQPRGVKTFFGPLGRVRRPKLLR